jgi:hypothetical protein
VDIPVYFVLLSGGFLSKEKQVQRRNYHPKWYTLFCLGNKSWKHGLPGRFNT